MFITRANTFWWNDKDNFDYHEEKKDCDYNFFYLNKNKEDILHQLKKGKPISALYFKDSLQTIFVAYSIGRYDIALMLMTFDPNSLVDEAHGMFFVDFLLKTTTTLFLQRNKLCVVLQELELSCCHLKWVLTVLDLKDSLQLSTLIGMSSNKMGPKTPQS